MSAVADFYALARWGSRWGVVDGAHPTPHKGLDVRAGSREAVPVLRRGRIVADSPSVSVGRYITVQVSSTEFDTYCHVVSNHLPIGTLMEAATVLAEIAGVNDPHGSAWTGAHLHLARSSTKTGWAYWGAANLNPEPVVLSVLTATAGGGVEPLNQAMKENVEMYIKDKSHSAVYAVWTDRDGHPRMRVCGPLERAYAVTGQLVITGNDTSLAGIAKECGWVNGVPPVIQPTATTAVDIDEVAVAKALAPLLAAGVTKADLDAVQAAVIAAIPRTFIAE